MQDTDRPRQMFQGNWKCGECGGAITELPFQPDPERTGSLKCGDCHRNSRPKRDGFRSQPRQMFQGDWKCSGCGGAITELPFQPDPERLDSLKCRDCHRNSR
ncbi:MAG: hypothetical protein COZ49_00155 [Candidatus Yonathbacteria bacterium CG_4_10_14_3_um_filter_47_65]|uniref:Uncharacterized protein n=1 Tax=Candidatus Yonathbacteria bacterium CG_4_9_14_0_8_um_filter_46_47 TaxID=1975106 RepID=A0A2M8D8J2_9BACT|nr:MAG: hypothetical protein COX54_02160 [Candidatus Yonathbacteria bacterium CG23_combo_of_CG06-09_8_20_14_all_46_18]PIQ31738.1 MAG: hypothetical protein COW61_03395 [Candidatus Yonathbacteria bacterium CG17_big_fil_post_rev_8_21_14_2_50_46_19]PIX56808.1 MAG: hypothetical protein COZ49_00155 [Candidatus Yonathbacteria bacterium CG_4_10_14_3_um_filter_47_65]PIY57714.1 MAG: hypothetical protein COY99_01790 [Candidatus Yonathbacteria bacterium CG_4_10_14_0_8_um_filter_47_645]PJB83457.1 MAG: hypot